MYVVFCSCCRETFLVSKEKIKTQDVAINGLRDQIIYLKGECETTSKLREEKKDLEKHLALLKGSVCFNNIIVYIYIIYMTINCLHYVFSIRVGLFIFLILFLFHVQNVLFFSHRLEEVIYGTASEVEEMVRCQTDITAMCTYIIALKR